MTTRSSEACRWALSDMKGDWSPKTKHKQAAGLDTGVDVTLMFEIYPTCTTIVDGRAASQMGPLLTALCGKNQGYWVMLQLG